MIATGKYIDFIAPLIASARKYFLKGHQVTFYVFTDNQKVLGAKRKRY